VQCGSELTGWHQMVAASRESVSSLRREWRVLADYGRRFVLHGKHERFMKTSKKDHPDWSDLSDVQKKDLISLNSYQSVESVC
jgi:hypothetical protein